MTRKLSDICTIDTWTEKYLEISTKLEAAPYGLMDSMAFRANGPLWNLT